MASYFTKEITATNPRAKVVSCLLLAVALTIGLMVGGGGPPIAQAASVCAAQVPDYEIEVEVCISLDPETDSNPVGTNHTVTATVTVDGDLVGEIPVVISVNSGPNAGDSGTGETNGDGQFGLTYTGDGGVGTDTIEACIVDTDICDTATKTWAAVLGIEQTPTFTPTPTVAAVQQLPATGSGDPLGSAGGFPWTAAVAAAIGALALTGIGTLVVVRRRL